jgi:predicted TIM-barrel fold metal-dependent hydrolase
MLSPQPDKGDEAMITRRAFMQRAAAAAAWGPAVSRRATVRAQASGASENLFPPATFFDIHVHLAQAWVARAPLSVSTLLRWMDARGIGQASVLPLISPEGFDYPVTTDLVLTETKPHRDRLIPFCDIDPRTGLNYQQTRDLLLKYKDSGARGLGEHKCGLPVDDPGNLELFRACEEVGFAVLIHTDTLRNMDKPGLPGFAKVLATFPRVNFLGHAQGFWSNISGNVTAAQHQEYPSGPVTPGGALDALLDKYPNLYCDLSAGSGHNAIARDPAFGRAFVLRRASRLVFGTDYLADGQAVPQFALYKSLSLPADVQNMVFRENARKLLGLR